MPQQEKTVILHGFSQQEILKIMRLIKKEIPATQDAIFASTTPTSLEWKLKDLIQELSQEHEMIKKSKNKP